MTSNFPKNILIVPGPPERVGLVDFDIAKTYPTKELLDEEVGICCLKPVQASE